MPSHAADPRPSGRDGARAASNGGHIKCACVIMPYGVNGVGDQLPIRRESWMADPSGRPIKRGSDGELQYIRATHGAHDSKTSPSWRPVGRHDVLDQSQWSATIERYP